VHLQVQPLRQDGQRAEGASMSTIEHNGKVIVFRVVQDRPEDMGCKSCLAERDLVLCADMPECHRVHFEEVA
jgi:hypothetical protein